MIDFDEKIMDFMEKKQLYMYLYKLNKFEFF